ncbi:baseplate J/gp47 family protein [Lentisphaerota bacterium ZTH]|nr:baseplate J/gp47 family protein [Lentisphaerota bacterium]WET05827.1 baseplate J/gp47 family protein [Lentisphaerota bacterium ZTH]
MTNFNAIDLSLLKAPEVLEKLNFEQILAEILADLKRRFPEFSAITEADPAYKILEAAAYREVVIRQRVNDAAKANMLAYATGSNLDHLGALFNIKRHVVIEATNESTATYEDDTALRQRILLALEGITTAGSKESYIFHALSACGKIADASVYSPRPAEVAVTLLSRENNGIPSEETLSKVRARLGSEKVRPLTDKLTVQAATIQSYNVAATLKIKPGAASSLIIAEAKKELRAYAQRSFKLGATVALSGIYAALHQVAGVEKVTLATPKTNITTKVNAAPLLETVTINVED